jgi:hypothetical protein
LRGDPSLIIQQKVDLQNQSSELEAIQGLYEFIESIAASMKPLLDQVPAPEPKGYGTNPLQNAGLNALHFISWLAAAKAEALAKAKVVVDALPPADASRREENAAQKGS